MFQNYTWLDVKIILLKSDVYLPIHNGKESTDQIETIYIHMCTSLYTTAYKFTFMTSLQTWDYICVTQIYVQLHG